MPNWCSNYIHINGDKEKISQIRNLLESIEDKGTGCVFKTLVGINPDITPEEYESGGWFESNKSFWGTKWDVSYNDCDPDFMEKTIVIHPNTAWAPPVEFGEALAKKFGVEVILDYSEPGCGFTGRTTIDTEGESISEDYNYMEGKYILDNESFWYELDDNINFYLRNDEESKKNTAKDYIYDNYPYLSKEDKIEAITIYNNKKLEYGNDVKQD